MAELEIEQIPVLDDNYVYLVREPDSGLCAVVDPAVSEPVLRRADELGWTITHILNTHHHGDHVGGNMAIKSATGCVIVGPKADRDRIPGIDIELADGERWMFGEQEACVFDVPGHTRGHICFWFAGSRALFIGDTLFALGCGRLFEGTPAQMWSSLSKLRPMPDDTRVYCAHEYTQSNARFAVTVETSNKTLHERSASIDVARQAGRPTVPSTLGEERATNPFLRADQPALQQDIGMVGAQPEEVFAEVRQRKDRF
ncbi:MAG: hydroxyacylglutathione hydrolase [Rhodospirillales bacterium]